MARYTAVDMRSAPPVTFIDTIMRAVDAAHDQDRTPAYVVLGLMQWAVLRHEVRGFPTFPHDNPSARSEIFGLRVVRVDMDNCFHLGYDP